MRFEITKATPTINKADAVLGVTTPQDIIDDTTVNGAPGAPALQKGTDYQVEVLDSEGAAIAGPALNKKYDTADAVTVQVSLLDPAQKNYEFSGSDSTTYTITPAVTEDGTYTASWKKGGDVTPVKGNAQAATIAYTGAELDGVADDIVGTFKDSTAGSTEVALSSTDFKAVWYDVDGKELGDGVEPTNPGVYTADVMLAGAAEDDDPVGQLTLTVQADLASQVKKTKGAGELITLTVNGCYPDDVRLEDTGDMTATDVAEQVAAALALDYNGTAVENPGDLFDYAVTMPTKGNPNGTVVLTNKAGAPQVFTNGLNLDFSFGESLPDVKEFAPVYYSPEGWIVKELVAFNIKSTDAQPAFGTDYTVTVYGKDGKVLDPAKSQYPIDAGTYKVAVTPVASGGNYVGEPQYVNFTIDPLPVTAKNGTFTWNGKYLKNGTFSMTYTGEPVVPEVGLEVTFKKQDGTVIDEDTSDDGFTIVPKYDYDHATEAERANYDGYIECENNVNVGTNTAVAKVTLVGNYSGGTTQNFSITTASLEGASVSATNQLAANFPENPTVADIVDPVVETIDGHELTLGTDYDILSITKKSATKNTTTYSFTVRGKGSYTGDATGEFNVTNKDLAELAVASLKSGQLFFYNTGEQPAEVVVNLKGATANALGQELTKGTDYDVTYENNVNAGTATAVITGDGEYAGELTVDFEIQPLLLDGASAEDIVLGGAEGLVYNGKAFEPEVLYNKSKLLPANVGYRNVEIYLDQYVDDLTYTYENNTNASTAEAPAYVVVSGKTGNFKGSVKVPFTIAQADIAKATVEAAPVAPGGDLADAVKVTLGEAALAAGTDYTVAAEGALPGKVTATVTGTGNYTGTATADVDVLYDVAGLSYQVSSGTYNGQSQTPVVTASYKDAAGKTVEVPASALNVAAGSYVNAGTYKIKVAGNNAAGWGGETTVGYTIAPATVTAKPQVSYAGGLPVVTVPGLTSNDFDWKADAATQTITVTYKGNYKGTAKVAYTPTVAPGDPGSAAGKTGWVGSGDDWAYYKDGKQVKDGWKWIDGAWYHFEKSGKMTDAQWFQDKDGKWYLLNQDHDGSYGAMLTGWQLVGKDWYYMGASGDMQSGWLKDGGEWYLLNTAHDGTFGKMLTGWQQDADGKWYYMDASGAMASNAWVGRYWVNGSGVWTATR
ncbi:N-acetylmuramoyl-L-alanine amidase family protein [Xiamenia xianingshaonis]|uniref:Uncharacterized protein n=1 Tax=Xiamenia xianingshaonis TaxID=2682776 RepID=A0A9E6MPA8_9ACTN|nr:hypothetical protein [Xiamenia xianingshaonis]NHM14075.1 hypothetical protein [Xiamenia xianingshaonis]QTU83939.1 hypothetical protein J7S26_06110 [Xiamenia xianingshaonis]